MHNFKIKITTKSPLQLGYGRAGIVIDSDVVHDKYGMPYFPAKRFKGLLYESALEIAEIFDEKIFTKKDIDKLFGQGEDGISRIYINNFYLKNYEKMYSDWQYLNSKYKGFFTAQSILDLYTDIRYQTTIDKKTGTTVDGSLHNMRIIDAGTEFYGEIILIEDCELNQKILALALKNLRFAGAKRNRGCGRINCLLINEKELPQKIFKEVI